jgi:hypothetical protein
VRSGKKSARADFKNGPFLKSVFSKNDHRVVKNKFGHVAPFFFAPGETTT